MGIVYRGATLSDVDNVQYIVRHSSKCFGFIMKQFIAQSIIQKEVIVAVDEETNRLAGFVRFHYLKKRQMTRIEEICTEPEYRGQGIAKRFLLLIPHRPIILDCPVDNESNKWYQSQGFHLNRVRTGSKRALNEWIKN